MILKQVLQACGREQGLQYVGFASRRLKQTTEERELKRIKTPANTEKDLNLGHSSFL